ncbi:hypothetical protein J4N45_01845 [Vibrio sp. SCSIO 43140]|uniref:hypothetical protein n=1 Tax=Vibrio sp. SCSIO 43140 TaxID=2819100 RepID=UPI002075885F|nr:hypothetical protein [Vibrio sp. SCSIO 43140]USD60778.1 hypothetical protein J4N45_01845 [Vibrio sp. SCSIO 43140]
MSKTPNPVRGYVPCPVCSSTATVHMVGEGRLIDSGETVKNGRNLGLLYYKCPSCGNSSMSKTVSGYCTDNMTETKEALQALSDKVEPTVEESVESTVESVESFSPTVTPPADVLPPTEPSTTETTESTPPKTSLKPKVIKVTACLGVIVVLLFAIKRMLAKPQPSEEGDSHE